MSSVDPYANEKKILQEDCAEDNLKNGILTLTSRRIIFEKTEGRMATLSKKTGDVLLDISLRKISNVKAEGYLIKKVVLNISDGNTYKFGVFSPKKWAKAILEEQSRT